MPLLRATDLCLAHGHHVLLEQASFQLFKGDRACLVGRNGAGKSTLMKVVEGSVKPDDGNLWRRPSARIAMLDQDLPAADHTTVIEWVASGLETLGQQLQQYQQLATEADETSLKQLEKLQQQIEAQDGWRYQQRIDEVLSRLELPAQQRMSELSGGWRKRVALAKALVTEPDVLLLDEPTNHLDLETIQWLEKQLLDFNGAILFVTHDRALVRSLATCILELDRGRLQQFNTGYDAYLKEKAHLLEVEEQQNALFDKKLAQEEVWIRQGIKARRTRNEGRVRALHKLREQRSQRREVQGKASIQVGAANSSGKRVAELNKVSYHIGDIELIKGLDLTIVRGDKVGLLGPNGAGKTTLLKILLGELAPSAGKIKLGTKLEVAYFDQLRSRLEENKTIVDIVGQGRESITINGRDRHIMSYLADFLFSPERARTPVKALSGGEKNRVQLACLFSLPANVLVMDEPTNDLDVETLELLESVLVEFQGTVLLVSHDREFMDNVVTSTLAFEGDGHVIEYVGGYRDWLRQGGSFERFLTAASESVAAAEKTKPAKSDNKPQAKLSYKDKRELDKLPEKIEQLEQQQQQLQEEVSTPEFYQQARDDSDKKLALLANVSAELEQCYERWIELSE